MKWHIDPGHGWLEVSRETLKDLGIYDKISSFSYENNNRVYLEEDCDVTLFFDSYLFDKNWYKNEVLKIWLESIPKQIYEKDCIVRTYQRYKPI